MKIISNVLPVFAMFLLLLATTSCGGGGGGSAGIVISGRIVNESGSALTGGQHSVQGSGNVGTIGGNGAFSASSPSEKGRVILMSAVSGFRFRRVPFDTSGAGSLNLGDVTLANDNLSKGWGAYNSGNLSGAVDFFNAHISASGRDLADARNGLGWALVRLGQEEDAFSPLIAAAGNGFDSEVRTALASAYLQRSANGTYAIPSAISNMDLAIGDSGYYLSKPLHDDISEDDLIAFRGMLNLLDGRTGAAATDRNTVRGNPNANLNKASEDMLEVLDFFLSH